jgi:hypothetical protein
MERIDGCAIHPNGKIPIDRMLLAGKRVEKHIRCSGRGSGKSAHDEGSFEVGCSLNTFASVQLLPRYGCKTYSR